MSTDTINLDLAALQAEIDSLSPEEIQKQLLEVRTRQRVQQKKYQNSDAAKAYRKKRAEMLKLVAQKAKALGIYDQILKEAEQKAAQLTGEAEAEAEDVEV